MHKLGLIISSEFAEVGRNAILLALHFGVRIDPSSCPLGARYVFALPSLYVHRPPFSPRFVCSAFSAIVIFPYYLPHARRDAPRFAKPSPVTRFLYFRRLHRDARDRSCERGDLGLRNAKIFPTYTRRFGREREATSWDSSSTKRRISNYELLLLALLLAPPFADPLSHVRTTFRLNFLNFSLSWTSIAFLRKRSG